MFLQGQVWVCNMVHDPTGLDQHHQRRNPKANTGNRLRRNTVSGRFGRNRFRPTGGTPAFEKSGKHGGVPQKRFVDSRFLAPADVPRNPAGRPRAKPDPNDPRRRSRQDVFRSKRPTNPHDPRSKDPFMRAGIGLGTNDTKIFTRAGMSMDLKKMRKMF